MDIDKVKEYQKKLEDKFRSLDDQMNMVPLEDEVELNRLEELQDQIDEELDLLDDVLVGIYEIPKKYDQIVKRFKKYEELLDE